MMKKKFLSLLLACSLSLSAAAMPVLAADADVQEPLIVDGELQIDQPEPDIMPNDGWGLSDNEMRVNMEAAPGLSNRVNGHRILFQNAPEYRNAAYGSNTIYNAGCGPASVANAIYELGLGDVSVKKMCEMSLACGARYDGGTNVTTLLKYVAPKYGLTFTTTDSRTALKDHLAAGKVAIIHAGTAYPLLCNSGHFLTACGIKVSSDSGSSLVTIMDSYWESNKYTSTQIRRDNVKVLGAGLIQCTLLQLDKACLDRSPEFYLIDKASKVHSSAQNGDAPFTDVMDNMWYYSSVVQAYKKGLMSGVSKTTFAPKATMTRAMVAQVLYHMAGEPKVSGTNKFTDVSKSAWYYKAVLWATQKGITAGTSSTKFSPNQKITREQLATMLYAYAGKPKTSASLSKYSDRGKVSSWAVTPMKWAVGNGILSGSAQSNGTVLLQPKGNAIRAQAATILVNYAKYAGK